MQNDQKSTAGTNRPDPLKARLGIEYRSPASLTPYEGNPRKHPERKIVQLMASIGGVGMPIPILIDEGAVVIAGHARLEAAKRLGMTEVPVIVASHWSPAQIRSYRIADNKIASLSSWDNEKLLVEIVAIVEMEDISVEAMGFETAEIDLMLEGATTSGGASSADPADEVPDCPEDPVTHRGDLWRLGKHRLLCGSTLEPVNWVRLMQGETAAMVFSDMPYNVPIKGHVSGLRKVKHTEFAMASGEMDRAQFTGFAGDSIGNMAAPLKDGGVLTLAMDWKHSPEILAAIEANRLKLLNMCVWNKSNGGMGSLYRSKHELFWIAKKGKASHTNNVELGKHGRYRANVWDYPGVNSFGKSRSQDLADHPTVKPVALVADAIRDVTMPGEIVIDGFIGSGSTILAAERTKRRCYGVEIEPKYVDVALRRWSDMTGQQPILDETGETFAEVAVRRRGETADPVNFACAA